MLGGYAIASSPIAAFPDLAQLISIAAQSAVNVTTAVVRTNWASALLVRAGNGTVLNVQATNFSGNAGFLVGYNAPAIPADGALTPALVVDCVPIAAYGSVRISDQPGLGTNYTQGIVYFFTSAATGYTKASGNIAGSIRAVMVQ